MCLIHVGCLVAGRKHRSNPRYSLSVVFWILYIQDIYYQLTSVEIQKHVLVIPCKHRSTYITCAYSTISLVLAIG